MSNSSAYYTQTGSQVVPYSDYQAPSNTENVSGPSAPPHHSSLTSSYANIPNLYAAPNLNNNLEPAFNMDLVTTEPPVKFSGRQISPAIHSFYDDNKNIPVSASPYDDNNNNNNNNNNNGRDNSDHTGNTGNTGNAGNTDNNDSLATLITPNLIESSGSNKTGSGNTWWDKCSDYKGLFVVGVIVVTIVAGVLFLMSEKQISSKIFGTGSLISDAMPNITTSVNNAPTGTSFAANFMDHVNVDSYL
jgi:hypothetical protein